MSKTKEGSTSKFIWLWMQMVCRVRILVTEGILADCKEAVHLIECISAEILLANRGYDTNNILAYAVSVGMESVISHEEES